MIVSQPGILSSRRRSLVVGLTWTSRTSGFTADEISNVAYDGSKYWVTVGGNGKIYWAINPTGTWTAASTPGFGTTLILDVHYGSDGLWVAVGFSGKIGTATDPTGTWTQETTPFSSGGGDFIASVYHDGTTWTAVGSGAEMATATDPTGTWTSRTSSFTADNIYGVYYGDSIWCAVGDSGKIATASDPTSTWTQRTSPFSSINVRDVTYDSDSDLWVATAYDGEIATTADATTGWALTTGTGFGASDDFRRVNQNGMGRVGTTGLTGIIATSLAADTAWTQNTDPFSSTNALGISYGADGYWMCSAASAKLASAPEPDSKQFHYDWTSRTMNCGTTLRGVGYDGTTWVAVSADGAGSSDISTSTDAQTWTNQESGKNVMRDVDGDGSYWVAVGDSAYMLSATDPTGTWTSRTSGFGSTNIAGIYSDGTTWIAMGFSGVMTTTTDPTGTWTVNSSAGTVFSSYQIRSACYDGSSLYVAVGDNGILATATDPTSTWTARTSSFGTTFIRYVTYSSSLSLWCAVGSSGKIATASDPTGTWTQRTSRVAAGSIITTVQWDATKGVFVAVTNASEIISSEDGINWISDDGGFTDMWDLKYGDGFLVVVGSSSTGKTSFS